MKILIMTDNPNIDTGMARVGANIATSLCKGGHEVVYIGWFSECQNRKKWPFKLYASRNQTFGRDIFDSVVVKERPDIVMTIGDPWMYDYIADGNICKTRGLFQWVGYLAVDGEAYQGGVPKFWSHAIKNMDQIVAYTEYGRRAILKTFPEVEHRLNMIYHGVDEEIYRPLSKEDIEDHKSKLGIADKKIFLVVARNHGRKNWPEVFKAWRKVLDNGNCPNSYLWPHTYFYDSFGHNMDNMLAAFNLTNSKTIIFSEKVARGQGVTEMFPEAMLNTLYNCADCLISAGGEGFGLPVIEAMATNTPCIVLNESATGELGADGRAHLVEADRYITGKYMTERPLPSIDGLVEKIEEAYKQPSQEMIDKAYSFAMENTWKKIGERWLDYFDTLQHPLSKPIVLEEVL